MEHVFSAFSLLFKTFSVCLSSNSLGHSWKMSISLVFSFLSLALSTFLSLSLTEKKESEREIVVFRFLLFTRRSLSQSNFFMNFMAAASLFLSLCLSFLSFSLSLSLLSLSPLLRYALCVVRPLCTLSLSVFSLSLVPISLLTLSPVLFALSCRSLSNFSPFLISCSLPISLFTLALDLLCAFLNIFLYACVLACFSSRWFTLFTISLYISLRTFSLSLFGLSPPSCLALSLYFLSFSLLLLALSLLLSQCSPLQRERGERYKMRKALKPAGPISHRNHH